jgi:dipeptidyl aminopeptidase/acylaminoacyl peptidase
MTVERYGAWPSPLTPADAVAGAPRFGDVSVVDGPDGPVVRWTEGRPAEGGRSALVEWRSGTRTDLAARANVRTRMNEYGGGSFWVVPDGAAGGQVVLVDDADARPYLVGDGLVPLAPEPPSPRAWRYAAGSSEPDGAWSVVERERHCDESGDAFPEAVNDLCVLDHTAGRVLELLAPGDAGTGDFMAAPAVSPDGTRLAWLRWDHPDMPWDAAELWSARLEVADGSARVVDPVCVAGGRHDGRATSACLPSFGPDATLWFSDDRDGSGGGTWRLRNELGAVVDVPGEVGEPRWVSGGSRYGFLADGRVALAALQDGFHTVWIWDPATGRADQVPDLRYVELLVADGSSVVVVGGGPDRTTSVLLVDPTTLEVADLRPSAPVLDPASVSLPRHVTFPTAPTPADATDEPVAHALVYPPQLDGVAGPADSAPPLVVRIHGGPTASARPELSTSVQFWTTRGFAVADVNYRGSTGYGRDFRDALRGQWGVADVADCLAVAGYLAGGGLVDGERCVIRGGSAGGFTALASLCSGDVMAGACVLYAVTDLLTLDDGTHKFESRYNDGLVGPRPDSDDLYRERSPLTHAAQISVPVLVLQGTDDLVVPLEQADALVATLREQGTLYDYLVFEGEGHGFRQAAHLVTALESELAFYQQVLGLG